MTGRRSTLALACALVAGVLVGYVMWTLADRTPAEPPRPESDTEAVLHGAEPGVGPLSVPLPEVPREPGAAPDPSWRVLDAPFRQIVEIALVPAAPAGGGKKSLPHDPIEPPRAARCAIALGLPARRVRVFDSEGKEVRSRLVEGEDGGDGRTFDLYFEASSARAGDLFEVYYPASGEGKVSALEAGPYPDGDILVTVYKVNPRRLQSLRRRARRIRDIARAMEGSKALGRPRRRTHIDDRESPFGTNDNYVAVYQSYLACPYDGVHEFGIDADDMAVLLIDGREVLSGGRPGKLPDRPFPYRARRKLKAGLHEITLYHVQTTELLRARLAWRPEGARRLRVIPPSAFVSHIRARSVRLDLRDRPGAQAFFRAEPGRRLVVNRAVPVTLWNLTAAELPPDLPGARWVWREGGSTLGEGRELQVHVSGLRVWGPSDAAAGLGPGRDITLVLETGESEHSRYTRRLRALEGAPEEAERLTLQLEVASAPNFVYPHEHLKLILRAINDSAEPVSLEVVEHSRERPSPAGRIGGEFAASRRLGEFELPAVGLPDADVLARRMNVISLDFAPEVYERIDRLVYLLGPPRAPAVRLTVDLLSSRERLLPGLRAEAGGFLTDTGARGLFVLPYDRESDHRRFGFIRGLSEGPADSGKALIYGDDLASPGARGGEGLVPRMREELGDRVELSSVPFPEGTYPIDAAVAGVDAALLEKAWGRIWVSVGTLDVRAGTPVREFARGLDAVIDRVRTLRPGARLVIVGPPPEWSREDVSRRYAETARAVAEQHHVAFADLHALVESMSADPGRPPGSPWRDAEDDVYFPYPLGPAMDAVAREVLRR